MRASWVRDKRITSRSLDESVNRDSDKNRYGKRDGEKDGVRVT